jgi:GntR family transcriptional regulator/MocR family aminotransferase
LVLVWGVQVIRTKGNNQRLVAVLGPMRKNALDQFSVPMSKILLCHELALPQKRTGESLSRWLYRELRAAILEGRLKPGALLPPTRALAAQYGVSRGTVVAVFERLISEGYLEARVGSGTSVNRKLPDDFFGAPAKNQAASVKPAVLGSLSERGKRMAVSPFLTTAPSSHGSSRAFCANRPSVDHFPLELWGRLGSRRLRLASRGMLSGGDAMGYPPLREAVAAHLGSTRGVVCSADQVMVVSGTQQALDLVTRVVLDPGDMAWMEDPGYPGAAAILRANGAKLVEVRVDARGLCVDEGLKRSPKARFAFVTPAHQYPLGFTLSLERRLRLLEWSRTSGAWIFEDDYDSEFRFAGRPLAALQGLAPEGNVLFAGSFSKMLFPSLRLGFVVIPPHLVEPMRAARSLTDRYRSVIEQAVLCDFIAEGHFGQHLRRMREVYAERLEVLQNAAEKEWGERLRLHPTNTGLQTVGWLARNVRDREFARAAAACGVEVTPLSGFALHWATLHGLQIGFASAEPQELRRGVTSLAKLLR